MAGRMLSKSGRSSLYDHRRWTRRRQELNQPCDKSEFIELLQNINENIKHSPDNHLKQNGIKITRINDFSIAITGNFQTIKGIIPQAYLIYLYDQEKITITNWSGEFIPLTSGLINSIYSTLTIVNLN